jgi:hypothetical protein
MEVFRTDPAEKETAHWYDYIKLFAQLCPWTLFFIAGLCAVAMSLWRIMTGSLQPSQRNSAMRLIYVASLILVPILIMSLFRDRKVRYLYPFAIPCGIVTAKVVIDLFEIEAWRRVGRWLVYAHWLVLAGLTTWLCIAGMLGKDDRVRLDGSPWFTPKFGISAAVVCATLIIACALVQRGRPPLLIFGSLLVMLLFQAINIGGNSVGRAGDGASEMLPVARALWEKYPDAVPYNIEAYKDIPPELAIYLNRPIKRVNRIPDDAQTQVCVIVQKRGEPQPQPEPGWKLLMKTPRDKDWWFAFVRAHE